MDELFGPNLGWSPTDLVVEGVGLAVVDELEAARFIGEVGAA
jgi:hypothetical protein